MKLSTSCGRTAKRVTLCRGGHAGPPLHELHQHDNTTHQTHTEGPRRGPTNHSRGSKGQSPERPTEARRHLIYRPLVGRTRRIYNSSPTSRQGRSFPLTHLYPPVVRSFAPPTGGYDSSDRKRSLPSSPALALLYDNGTSSDISGRSSRIARPIKTLCAPIRNEV